MRRLTVRPAGGGSAPLLAVLHAEAFAPADRWGEQAIALMLDLPGHLAFIAATEDEPLGFVMGRVAADQAEVLTIAIRPMARRAGLGRMLMGSLMAEAGRRGAAELFLEVAESNAAARGLYAALGATPVGRRRGYYPDGGDALVLRLLIKAPGAAATS